MEMTISTLYEQNAYESVKKDWKRTENKEAPATQKTAETSAESTSDISKTNESKLSSKAQDYLEKLREQYGDYDFLVGNSTDDLESLAKNGSKEYSVIFTNEELERMADDEDYAAEKMKMVEDAVSTSEQICEENGFTQNGTINKIAIAVSDDGSMKIFAELEKSSEKQMERIEKAREKRAEEKEAAEDKAEEKKAEEKIINWNPYEEEASVKRTTVEAESVEELQEKIQNIEWDKVSESHSGDRFDLSV